MAPKGAPEPRPLVIPFFGTGLYTYRNQLFSPFRGVGVNVVSYHDAVIDGRNMELTDLLEWQQRPAFTQYCNVPLNNSEIINQFYGIRALNGTLLSLFDSNQRLSFFTPTSITTLYEKNTDDQGFVSQVGNTTYFFDGTDAVRYDQTYNGPGAPYGVFATPIGIPAPTTSMGIVSTGVWLPNTKYSVTTYPGTPLSGGNGYDVSLVTGGQVTFWPHIHHFAGQFEYTFPGNGFNIPLGSNGASSFTYNLLNNQSCNFNTHPQNFIPGYPNANQQHNVPMTAPGVTVTGTWDSTDDPMWGLQPEENFCLVFEGQLLITKAGTYTFQFSHDDGALVGIGNGAIFVSSSVDDDPDGAQTLSALKGYPLMFRNNVSGGFPSDSFVVHFPVVGIYGLEIDLCNWEHGTQCCLDWLNPEAGNALTPLVPTSVNGGASSGAIGAVLLDYNGNIEYSGASSGISGSVLPTWAALPGSFTNDGTTLKWENLGPIGSWLANTAYTQPSVILDSNGNLQMLFTLNAPPVWNSAISFNVGEFCQFGQLYYVNILSGANNPPGSNTTTPGWILAGNPAVSGATEPVWATNIGGFTNDNLNSASGLYWMVWQNLGPGTATIQSSYSYIQCLRTLDGHLSTGSASTTPIGPQLQGSQITPSQVVSFSITSNVVTFIAPNTFAPGEFVYVQGMQTGTYLNDQVLIVQNATPNLSYAITGTAVTSNVVTITANNSLVAGQTVTLSGLTTSTFLNTAVLTVLSTGLSSTQFEANFTHANYSFVADTGEAALTSSFTAIFNHANVSSTADVGTVTPIIAQISGTGTADARCNASATITNVALQGNTVTIQCANNFFPGTTVLITGLTGADWLNDFTLLIDTATPTQFTAFFQHNDYAATADSGTATLCGIEIYRTADGGGIWYLAGAVVNPGATSTWNFVDIFTDNLLENQIVAPIAHLNDPPPGQPGSFATPFAGGSICTYWQGRLWVAQGQYLYFDAGPDCQNGDPHQSWPPGNRFEFAGNITGLAPLEKGLLVWIGDRLGVVLGGPQTLTFYPVTVIYNFGLSDPNCLWIDGQTCFIVSSQGQCYAVTMGGRNHLGQYVADVIQETFSPTASYIAFHRNGLDTGLFLSDGSATVLRYGSNIGAWSVPGEVVGGIGAMASVETSPNEYSLVCAPPGILIPPVVTLTISPTTHSMSINTTEQFTYTLMGTDSLAVSWSVLEGGGGMITTGGLYTAPSVAGTYHVTVRSVEDSAAVATAVVTVT